jgi:hypothetical protein
MEELPIPLSRVELYLAKIAGVAVTIPEKPINRLEMFLAVLAGDTSVEMPAPINLTELWLAYVGGITPSPLPAVEGACYIGPQKVDVRYFARAAGMPGSPDIPEPQNRTEQYWYQIASNVPIVGFLKYATGIEMTLTDILSGIEELEFIYGDTYQQTYSGKNLFSLFHILSEKIASGSTITMNNGASYTVTESSISTTASGNDCYLLVDGSTTLEASDFNIPVTGGTDYTLSYDCDGYGQYIIRVYSGDGTQLQQLSNTYLGETGHKTATFTTDASASYLRIRLDN